MKMFPPMRALGFVYTTRVTVQGSKAKRILHEKSASYGDVQLQKTKLVIKDVVEM